MRWERLKNQRFLHLNILILEVFELEKVSRHHYATQIEKCKMLKKVLEVHGKMGSYRKVFKARSS